MIPCCPPLETQRLRNRSFFDVLGIAGCQANGGRNKTKQQQQDSPPGPPPGEGGVTRHLRRAVSSFSRSPVSGPFAPAHTARFGGGLERLGDLPVAGSMTLPVGWLLWQRGSGGSCREAPMATSRLRGCSRVGSNRLPPTHDVSDHLSLPLCCRELLCNALDSVAEEAGL